MPNVDVLVAVRREQASRYYKSLSANKDFRIQLVSDTGDAFNVLGDREQHIDVLVLDNGIGQAYDLISELRQTYPRLFIVLVDEEADFGMPGMADEISVEPFTNDDLARRISRLMSDRQLETLRADSLPAVRQFAKELRKATGELGKFQTAVAACKDLGYSYVAFYRLEAADPLKVTLRAQDGSTPIQAVAPKQATADDLMAWVALNGQSRIAGPNDKPNHPLVARGRLGAVACVPVTFSGNHYGVLVACRDQLGSITQENVLMLELIAAQLASVVSKEIVS
jgi:GAF domain-containing protein